MDENNIKNIKNDKFAALVGIKLLQVGDGYALTQMEVSEKHLNGINFVQGGAIFTLADYAFAAAANAKGLMTVGITNNISFIKPPKGKIITAEAREASCSRKLCVYNVDVFDDDKELIAQMSAMGYIKNK
ncbi:PaaI family thioesterase [Dehalobacterium formicoaceticum]|uniref:PaaI family thioesterase n=1 Tax=Dehalobacterium formicoaceticum TaxID=51515 RepID=A0ABT1Y3T6_9FIRM|nr:PaaI family thioesterase [Dehalobacterium formicoaceticum]MCR6545535.1 PaaI family thioesterase [Dehalobacterium formicoaceticum]